MSNTKECIDEQRRLLQDALDGNKFQLALQSIVEARSARTAAFQALLRSRHPAFESPLVALAAAVRTGTIDRLSERIFALAAKQFERLPPETALFVNVHPAELADPSSLCRRLEPLRPVADRVVLELTERRHVADAPRWLESMAAARSLGFAIAIDNLGAGYDSLSLVDELEPDYIKLDLAIVRDIDRDRRKARIAGLLCRLATLLGALVVAEGVETEEEEAVLLRCGVDYLQGYRFGHPSLSASDPLPAGANSSAYSIRRVARGL